MKSIASCARLVLLIFSIFFSGCNVFDKVDDISFNTQIENYLTVSETTVSTTSTSYNHFVIIDAISSAEINKYKNKIIDITINKITYKIFDYTGAQNITTTGSIGYSSFSGGSQSTSLGTISPEINLQNAATAATEFDLPISSAELLKIAALLKDDKAVKFYLTGVLSSTPATFKIKFIIDARITVSAS